MIIKRNYNIYPDRNSVRVKIEWNARKSVLSISLPYNINREKWSNETKRCVRNSIHNGIPAHKINTEIDNIVNRAEEAFIEFEQEQIMPSLEQMRAYIKGNRIDNTDTIDHLFSLFIEKEAIKDNWAKATKVKFITLKNHLQQYKPNATIEQLDIDYLDGMLEYFIGIGFNNSSTQKVITNIKWFIHWLIRNEYYSGNVLDKFQPRIKSASGLNEVIYLSWDELMYLYEYDFEPPLAQVRDAFCFCCFTSLRYSDLKNLKRSNIYENCIKIVTQKTSEPLTIELNKYSAAILNKYSGIKFPLNRALPVMSNQKMNEYLKDVAKVIGLNEQITRVKYVGAKRVEQTYEKWELITTHCGRRTFIVNALYLGIPAEVVMKWTGHADYKAMKPYIAIVDDLKRTEMDKFNR